jgi:hypothetical protein
MRAEVPPQIGKKPRSPGRVVHRSHEKHPAVTDSAEPSARTARAAASTRCSQFGDAPIRAALRARLTRQLQHRDTVLIEELGLCRGHVRADVTIVKGSLHAYEIKSDRDTLDRLLHQAATYNKIFDRVTLVVGARHHAAALSLIPPWWGVLGVVPTRRGLRLQSTRRALQNRAIDPRSLVELLWLEDALTLLESRRAARGVRGKPRELVWDRVCENFDVTEIAAAVRDRLKTRATQRTAPPGRPSLGLPP